MPSPRRRWLASCAVGAFLPLVSSLHAQTPVFPDKTVHLVVPFPPGGATDALARQMADLLTRMWGQSVVVDNRPGGNTLIGTEVVARSAPDGCTLGIVTGSHSTNPFLLSRLPYDTLKDLTGVMLLTRFQMAVYAATSFPGNSLDDLLRLARAEPGKLQYAYATTQTFLGVELFDTMAGIHMQSVPYKGSAQAMTDLLGGHIPLLVDPLTQSAMSQVHAGKLKLLGTLGERASSLAPGAPLASAAVPGYDFAGAFGLVVRAGTPARIVRKIRDDFAAVLVSPEVTARLRDIGQDAVASTPEEYNAYILAEMKKWEPVIKATGVKLD
jgi:tripartite-type tricarboxylate transporter receptor subunit TctC